MMHGGNLKLTDTICYLSSCIGSGASQAYVAFYHSTSKVYANEYCRLR